MVGNGLDSDQTAMPWAGEPSAEIRDATGRTYPYNSPAQQPTHEPTASYHLGILPTVAARDQNDASFSGGGAANAPLSNRYLRGPALTSDPMDWSYAYSSNTPLYQSIRDAGTNLYTDAGIGQQGANKEGYYEAAIPASVMANMVSR